jgi:hypothetical protein
LQVCSFSAETWTVVHELAINFAGRKVDKRHSDPVKAGNLYL